MMNGRHIVVLTLVTVLSLGVIFSCNRFEYGYDESASDMRNPNESEIVFELLWDGVKADDRPEGMTVLMGRKVHSLNYCYRLGMNGNLITEEADSSLGRAVSVANGEYYLMAFSDGNGAYRITDYSDFCEENALAMKDIYAEVPHLLEEDVYAEKNIIDLNPYSGYIAPAYEPLYSYLDKSLLFPLSAGQISLKPVDLARLYTFCLQLEAEAEVSIDRVVAVLSGVPDRVQMMSGLVSRNSTSKVTFDMCLKEGSGGVYEGQVRTLGLIASQDETLVVGPGILQVSVFAKVQNGSETIERVFYAGMNLKRLIEGAGLMILSEDKTGYLAAPQERVKPMVLEPVLKIMKDHIEAKEGEGNEVWFENDVEISPEV